MKQTNQELRKQKAIQLVDDYTKEASFDPIPTYSELLNALNNLSIDVLHNIDLDTNHVLRQRADESAEIVYKALV